MHRRRSALSVSATAALLIAAPLVTGCGSDARPGAAAIVEGERITVSQVQARAEAVRDAQRADPQSTQLIQRTGPLSRYTLSNMIREKVVERAAKDEGVKVTRRDLQQFRADQESAAHGAEALRTRMLQERAVAPGQIEDTLRMDLLVLEVAKALGVNLSSPQAGEVMDKKFTETAESMGIEISPRFGAWSNDQVSLTGSEEPWLKPAPQPDEPT
ncbi:SurA N-terminal domain-containing protein [Streptomyces gobiensis]|uniref:SurA N-terminal domain-containing protein n=1 Tax=Streptomyces gobiensis TaxID=2875706 RepID=UPI001E5D6044|nr:SurA N-terminal domain-containing protein [Streptomyces gobiensis]UGY91829.1 SurA N-terminal domain-containing protein [Streptomyces gobiensis]